MLIEKVSQLLAYISKNEKNESLKNLEIARVITEDIGRCLNFEIDKYSRRNIKSHSEKDPQPNKGVILVDIDDVLADFRSAFAKYCEDNGVKVNIDSNSYYFMEDAQESLRLFDKFVYSEHALLSLKRTKSSMHICSKLSQLEKEGYVVVFITSRSDDPLVKLHTESWLRFDMGHMIFADFDNVIYAKEKYSAAISRFGYDAIAFAIDDSPKHLVEYETHGIPAISPAKSYNANLNITGYYSDCDNYDAISKLIELAIEKRENS